MNEYVKNLNRIEFVVTMACTGKCRHCSEGEHINCKGHIDTEPAIKSIREICENYKIESLMTFGGERCFGVLADMDFLLVSTYEKDGKNPELLLYKKR